MSDTAPPPETVDNGRSDEVLARFLAISPAARAAAGHLRPNAEVRVTFTDCEGEWRFYSVDGRPVLEKGLPRDPDFDLRLAAGAVKKICARVDADIGELGVAFFERIIARDPENRIQVTPRNGLVKLVLRGWLAVLAQGGVRVIGWMAQNGLRGPGAVASALARLRK